MASEQDVKQMRDEERKVLTAADIQAMVKDYHKCGVWAPTMSHLHNPNPECGCMCGTVYDPEGFPILAHGGRNSPRCKHADERGMLNVQKAVVDASVGLAGVDDTVAVPCNLGGVEIEAASRLPAKAQPALTQLEKLLEETKGHVMTPEEKQAQAESWVRGEMGMRESARAQTVESGGEPLIRVEIVTPEKFAALISEPVEYPCSKAQPTQQQADAPFEEWWNEHHKVNPASIEPKIVAYAAYLAGCRYAAKEQQADAGELPPLDDEYTNGDYWEILTNLGCESENDFPVNAMGSNIEFLAKRESHLRQREEQLRATQAELARQKDRADQRANDLDVVRTELMQTRNELRAMREIAEGMELPPLDFSESEVRATFLYPGGMEAAKAVAVLTVKCRENQLRQLKAEMQQREHSVEFVRVQMNAANEEQAREIERLKSELADAESTLNLWREGIQYGA